MGEGWLIFLMLLSRVDEGEINEGNRLKNARGEKAIGDGHIMVRGAQSRSDVERCREVYLSEFLPPKVDATEDVHFFKPIFPSVY